MFTQNDAKFGLVAALQDRSGTTLLSLFLKDNQGIHKKWLLNGDDCFREIICK